MSDDIDLDAVRAVMAAEGPVTLPEGWAVHGGASGDGLPNRLLKNSTLDAVSGT